MARGSTRWTKGLAPWAAASALSFAALPVAAQSPMPLGLEFQVNTVTTNYQTEPSVAADDNGNFVVVWQSYRSSGTDTSGWSIQGQRYASDGSALGAEFQVNTYTTDGQFRPSVAAAANGDFVVVWDSLGSPGTDTSQASIQGQRYASDGSAQGTQFQVNSYTTDSQLSPSVAAAANGDFVVAWDSVGSSGTDTSQTSIQGQRYASDGSAQGAEFQVNTYTTSYQTDAAVAAADGGDFVVVWVSGGSSGTDTSQASIEGQRYASDGSAQNGEFQVNTYTTGSQLRPSVAAAANGDFVVVWDSDGSAGTDTSQASIQGQRYASGGSAQGGEFQVNTYTTYSQLRPSIAAAANGDFTVVWDSVGSSMLDASQSSIQGQHYAADGSARGEPFEVNTYTTDSQLRPSIAAAAKREFFVAWQSYGSSGTDTDAWSIQGQRYSVADAIAVPALSSPARFALGATLMLVGAVVLRAYGRVSRRSRSSA